MIEVISWIVSVFVFLVVVVICDVKMVKVNVLESSIVFDKRVFLVVVEVVLWDCYLVWGVDNIDLVIIGIGINFDVKVGFKFVVIDLNMGGVVKVNGIVIVDVWDFEVLDDDIVDVVDCEFVFCD